MLRASLTATTGPGSGAREELIMTTKVTGTRLAVLDEMHAGDIRGALGTIRAGDIAPRTGLSSKLKTLLAIVGPGLIVMVGANDAGAFATYGQAGPLATPRCVRSPSRWSAR